MLYQRTTVLTLLAIVLSGGKAERRLSREEKTHLVPWNPDVTTEFSYGEIYHLEVHSNEYMDLYCPQYDKDKPEAQRLTFAIFNVSEENFYKCTLGEKHEFRKIFDCNNPTQTRKLTTKFQKRSPNPLGFIFLPGHYYYYLAFSDLTKMTCENAMRMRIKVRHETVHHHDKATVKPTPGIPKKTPKPTPKPTPPTTTTTPKATKKVNFANSARPIVKSSTTTTNGANTRLSSATMWTVLLPLFSFLLQR